MPAQKEWRFCGKCHGLFFDGYSDKGRCPADGSGHQAIGFNFVLPHDVPPNERAQQDWRFCVKCHGLFFDGYLNKGLCPRGGGHQAMGFNFVLPHSVPGTRTAQPNWRFCGRCHGLFFDGYPNKGRCPGTGNGHQAIGFNFVLPHPIQPSVQLQDLGGSVNVSGSGFTPNSQVQIFYSYKHAHGFTSNGVNPIVIPTQTDGSFTGVTFNLTGRDVANINVKVVDNVTGTDALAQLR
ncbi:hypothetical protein BHL35_18555 [Bacillus cereus]|nr:hypothetical protein BHL35_18555 [Bacillus cereus]